MLFDLFGKTYFTTTRTEYKSCISRMDSSNKEMNIRKITQPPLQNCNLRFKTEKI